MSLSKQPLGPDEFAGMTEIVGRDLSGVDIHESSVEGKKFTDCVFKKNNLEDASFLAGTELTRCTFEECQLLHTVFSEVHLTDVTFKACTLDDVFFDPSTISSLQRVHFPSSHITETALDGCNFAESDFSEAELADVTFSNAVLSRANFRGAVLERVTLDGAQLSGADFAGSAFDETTLPEHADLTNVSFADVDARLLNLAGQKLVNANFTDANLRSVALRGANLDGARFTEGTMLDGADFAETTLSGAHFDNVDLSDLCFAGLKFSGAVFSGQVNFADADLSKCIFEKCVFGGSLLANADLADAVFDDCTFSGTCFDDAKLSGAKFVRCVFDSSAQENGPVSSFNNVTVDSAMTVLECTFRKEPPALSGAIKRGNSAYAGAKFDDPKTFKVRVFAGKNFTGTTFVGLSLRGVCFADATLAQTRFENCDLSDALFCTKGTPIPTKAAHFKNTVFSNCKMDGAVFAGVSAGFNGTSFEKCSGMGTASFSASSLAGATFHGIGFSAETLANANIQGATFGGVSFAGLDLSTVTLRGMHVDGPLDFTGATLSNADFSGFSLGESKFSKAVLSSVSFDGCDLTLSDFCGATLTSVSFAKAQLPGPEKFADFKVSGTMSFAGTALPALRFQCPSMRGFVFRDAVLSGVMFDGCDLTEADFAGAVFEGVSFPGSQLGKKGLSYLAGFTLRAKGDVPCDFSKCRLSGVDFSGMSLSKCKFVGATLERVLFDNCDLTSTDFEDASLAGDSVSFPGAHLSKASFRGTQFTRVSFGGLIVERDVVFAGATLDAPTGLSDIVCPKGLDLAGARLVSADFGGRSLAGFGFRGATLKDPRLCGCDLSGADFEGAVFQGRVELAGTAGIQAVAAGTDFSGATVCGASFAAQHVRNAKFAQAVFADGTTFAGARVVGCAFDGCDLTGVDFAGAVLANCSFAGARLPKVLAEAQRRGAQLARRCLRSRRMYDGRRLDLSADPLCSASPLHIIPDEVWHEISAIESLDLSGNDIELLVVPPAKARVAKTLRTLTLRDNRHFVIPQGGLPFKNLHTLDISGTAESPDMRPLRNLASLRSLTAARLGLTSIDAAACLPQSLTALDISDNALSAADFRSIPQLRSLSVARNALTALPVLHDSGKALTSLDVSDNGALLVSDKDLFAGLTSLTSLAIRNIIFKCATLALPRSLTSLDARGAESPRSQLVIDLAATPALAVLRMKGARMTMENFRTLKDTLTTLEVPVGGPATALPFLEVLPGFARLTSLALFGPCEKGAPHPFEIPEGVWALPALSSLSLTNLGISEIPECLGASRTIRELVLERNSLRSIPEFVFGIPSLRVLRIGGNPCDKEDYSKRGNPGAPVFVATHETDFV